LKKKFVKEKEAGTIIQKKKKLGSISSSYKKIKLVKLLY
jgi:hypothetical protein